MIMRVAPQQAPDKQPACYAETHAGEKVKVGKPATILIVDDHEAVRRSLSFLLAKSTAWRVCGEAINARDAIEKAGQLRPDVILLDISLPDRTGLDALPDIQLRAPQARVIIVSQHEPKQMLDRALASGAQAYVTKSDLVRDLLPAIRAVLGP
jgi:DNA-binding NarL/FixJ family response regulator